MIILMKKNATEAQTDHIMEWIESVGYRAHLSRGVERTIIGAVGDDRGKAQLKSAEYLPSRPFRFQGLFLKKPPGIKKHTAFRRAGL